ncbi:MAG: hypothetical protein WC838_00695 [Candidatus Margulisiibacteriota bacterium]|jgi:hypothetical protein
MPAQQVMLGTRVPTVLKEKLCKYCLNHGIKMSYFVSQMIREKLLEIAEDNSDLETARKRSKNAQTISQKEFDHYLSKRGIRS